jgi:hypothetical protein
MPRCSASRSHEAIMRREFGVPACTRTGRPDGSPLDATHSVRPSGVATFVVVVTRASYAHRTAVGTTASPAMAPGPVRVARRDNALHGRARHGTSVGFCVASLCDRGALLWSDMVHDLCRRQLCLIAAGRGRHRTIAGCGRRHRRLAPASALDRSTSAEEIGVPRNAVSSAM